MGHPRTQFRVKADLPVGFPYRFNSSFIFFIIKALGAGADLGGFGGWDPPPPGVQNFFFFALKIRKRNKACAVHCTVTLARKDTEL